jgi:hypothetical protein
MRDRQVEPLRLAEAAHLGRALDEPHQLADPGGAAMLSDERVLHSVQVEQLQGLRVLTRRDQHRVALRPKAIDDGPEHEDMRRPAHVGPDPHRAGLDRCC